MAPHSSTLACKIPWTKEPCSPWCPKSRTWLSNFTFTFHFHALEKEMATHSSVLAWRIPGTAEPGGLPSMGSHRVRHDWSDLAAAAVSEFGWEAVVCWPLIWSRLEFSQHLLHVRCEKFRPLFRCVFKPAAQSLWVWFHLKTRVGWEDDHPRLF